MSLSSLAPSASEAMPASVHIVRHGESTWNRAGRVQGQSPLAGGLTARGWVQASAVAGELERLLVDDLRRHGALVVASDLVRARQTASVIACRLGTAVSLHAGLREQRLALLEGRPLHSRLHGELVGEVVAGLWRDHDERPPGDGESVRELARRASSTVGELAALAGGRPLVLVAHGGLIRSLIADPSPASPASRPAPVPNATVVSFVVGPDGSLAPADPSSRPGPGESPPLC